MKLYQLPYSHYSAKVAVVIKEKQLQVELCDIPGGSQSSKEYLAINPTGLVPCLADDNLLLGESEVIAEYLEEKYPEMPMLPADAESRAKSRWLSRMHDLNIAPLLTEIYGLSLSDSPDQAQLDTALTGLHEQLDLIEAAINPAPFFFKDQFGISDATYTLSFWYATLLSDHFGRPVDTSTHPKLSRWFEAASARESVASVLDTCKHALGMVDEGARKSA